MESETGDNRICSLACQSARSELFRRETKQPLHELARRYRFLDTGGFNAKPEEADRSFWRRVGN